MKKNISMLVGIGGVLIVGVAAGVWAMSQQVPLPAQEKPLIATTLYPLEDWARRIGGDAVEVVNIIPDGTEAHDYEPTAQDLLVLEQADLVVSLGLGFDETITQNVPEEKLLRFADHAATRLLAAEHDDGHGHAAQSGEDPHVWLDFANMKTMVQAMAQRLETFSPGSLSRGDAYAQQLDVLEARYAAGLAQCETRNVIVAHDAFGYLGERFALTFHPIMGLSPEGEPDARVLAALTAEAEELGVTTVFFETLTSPAVAQTLAEEIGVQTAILDPAEGITPEARQQGQTFLGIMEQNLDALRQGLRCL